MGEMEQLSVAIVVAPHTSPYNSGSSTMSAPMAMDADQPLPPSYDVDAQSMMNLSLLDPPRWGWTALGGICDLLPPHEVSTILVSRETFVRCL